MRARRPRYKVIRKGYYDGYEDEFGFELEKDVVFGYHKCVIFGLFFRGMRAGEEGARHGYEAEIAYPGEPGISLL